MYFLFLMFCVLGLVRSILCHFDFGLGLNFGAVFVNGRIGDVNRLLVLKGVSGPLKCFEKNSIVARQDFFELWFLLRVGLHLTMVNFTAREVEKTECDSAEALSRPYYNGKPLFACW